jgi:terminase large subunit-like protein
MTAKPTKSIREILNGPFAAWLGGDDWRPWASFLCALHGEPMSDYEAQLYRQCTGRQSLPDKPFREAWVAVGRKGRKSATAAMLAVYAAVYGRWKRAAGETLRVMVVALSKDQARLVLGFAAAILESRPGLARLIVAKDQETIRLSNGTEIACVANSFRLVRGPTCVCAILDEVAIWWSDELAANPDREILRALKPAMITQPGSLLIGLSSPYAKKGLLFEKHRDHFGRDDSNILIWQADTATMNPQVDTAEIEQAYRDDPASAAAEFGAQFRDDLQSFITPEVVEACVDRDVFERSPQPNVTYFSAIDPAGGSGKDSMSLCVSHLEGETVVIDCIRERRPNFNPSDVVEEFVEVLKDYRCTIVHGDRWGGEFCRQPFRDRGHFYKLFERDKSAIYRDSLPVFNSRHVRLLDHRVCIGQLVALERRPGSSGRDKIDHPRGGHDDVCNAVCLAIVLATTKRRRFETQEVMGLPVRFDGDVMVPLGHDDHRPTRVQSVADTRDVNWGQE